ncbi:unnamed protein product, partial [Closterium sp. NIES-54]
PASTLPGPSPYSGPTRGLTERHEPESRPVSPESRPASPVRTVRAGRVSRPRPPPVPGTHSMTLRPSTAPQRVPLPSPPMSSLPDGPDPESDSLRAASPTVTRFLATVVTDPLFESSAALALVAELVDFAAACRLDCAASLVAESVSASVCPPFVGGECALGTDVLEDKQEDLEYFSAASPHLRVPTSFKMTTLRVLLHVAAQRDYKLHSLDFSTAFLQGSLHEEIWLRRPPGFTGSFPTGTQWSLRRPVYGLRQAPREWHDTLRTTLATLGFAPSTADPSLFLRTDATLPLFYVLVYVDDLVFATADTEALAHVKPRGLLHVAAQRDYKLHSLDFSTAFLQGSLHEEIWLRRPPGFTGSFPTGTQWSLRRPVYGLRQAPREWHDTLRTTLATLGFAPSTADPSLFLRTDATLPLFYVLVYVDDLVFATADTEALAHVKSEL